VFLNAGCQGDVEESAGPVVLRWPNDPPGGSNWGDKLNPAFVEALSGRAAMHSADKNASRHGPVYFVIGSGLSSAGPDAWVWGSGFIQSQQELHCPVERVLAVRGPLTRQRVVAAGGPASLPLGDPALLLPLMYDPPRAPQFDIGVIQHFRERGQEPLPRLPMAKSVRVIDITGGLQEVVDAVLSCKHIVSSSLHGLIVAHAYGLPATWLKISDRPLGDDFKFRDYWAAMGRRGHAPTDVRGGALIDPEETVSTPGRVAVDLFALLKVCPFISVARRAKLLARAAALAGQGNPNAIFNIHAGLVA
jgi:pyruvyltransferase